MTFVLADRINETSTIVGTGDITLDGAVVSFAAFGDVMSNTDTTYYVISQSTGDWEVGIGTYNSGPDTLTRTTVLQSTNADALVNFGVGTKSVFISQPADKAVYLDASGDVSAANFGSVDISTTGKATTGPIYSIEQAAADADIAAQGQIWVKNTTPNELWFTDDAGTDFQLGIPGAGDLLADGTVPLTADWDAGAFTITMGTAFLTEQAAQDTPVAGEGQIWVKSDTPNTLWFTDDAGTDFEISIDWKAGTEAGFHSLGIDDNASEEVFQMSDTEIILGGAGLPAAGWFIYKLSNTGHLFLTGGGASSNQGAQLTLYGGARATLASDLEFKADAGVELYYDHSASSWDFQANVLITTGTVTSGGLIVSGLNTGIVKDASNGVLYLSGDTTITTGAYIALHGASHAVSPYDMAFKTGVTTRLRWDESETQWDFQTSNIITTGTVTSGPHFITEQAAQETPVAGDGQFWVRNDAPNLPFFTDDAGTAFGLLTTHLQYAISDETTALTAADDKLNIRLPHGLYLTEVRASCNTAPTGATLIFDIEEAGVTVLSTLLTIDATETTSTTAAVPAVISDPNLADDALISFNIDQVGSSVAGTGAKITLIGYRTT